MTVITTTLYYDGFGYDDDDFIGRALTKDEYDNITADEIRDAANHSIYLEELGIGESDKDLRPSPEAERTAKAMSAEQWKETLQQYNAVLVRCRELSEINVFPVFTKGPRKGQTNWKKEPEVYMDRWYRVEFLGEHGAVGIEGKVFLHENGTFSVLEKAAA